MAVKHKNLFLYLTLACFLGLILIFIFDGYMGVYDNLFITTGEYEQEIEADFWLRQDRFWSVGANWGEKVLFRYEVDNRQFSRYEADIEVSIWHSQEKVLHILSQPLLIDPFDNGELDWVVDTEKLKPGGVSPEQPYEFSVIIKRGELEQRIILYLSPVVKPYPTPTR